MAADGIPHRISRERKAILTRFEKLLSIAPEIEFAIQQDTNYGEFAGGVAERFFFPR